MLHCEVADILHWQEISAISLFVKIERTEGQLLVSDTYFDGDEELSSYLDDSMCKLDVSKFFHNGYSKFDLDYFPSCNSKPYIYKASLEIPEYPQRDKLAVPGYVSGLWIVMPITAKEIVTSNEDFVTIQGFFLEPDAKQPADVIIHMPAVITIMKGELWVTRPDLEKLYKSITTGESLDNIYNNAELAQRAKEQTVKSEQRQQMIKPVTGENAMLSALGTMAVLLYEAKGQSLKWGEKLNQSRIADLIKDMAVELGLPESGLDNIRKDIGRAVSQEPFKRYFQTKADIQKQFAQK